MTPPHSSQGPGLRDQKNQNGDLKLGPEALALKPALTPLMQQYHALKAQHPQELLFFHLGDFYELFDEDARQAAPVLEVTLTHRQDVAMCGVPVHAVNTYIAKLLKAGLRVAIADQLEEPSQGKGLVKRGVVRVMTAGTLQEDALLNAKRSNFLASVFLDQRRAGLAALECSTGEFITTEVDLEPSSTWRDELQRLAPSEVVLASPGPTGALKDYLQKQGIAVAELPAVDFSPALAEERLKKLYAAGSLRGFGLEGKPLALAAAGALVRYMDVTQCGRPYALKPLRTYSLEDHLLMDAHTLDHLDIQSESGSGSSPKTLLDVIDQTLTPMGGRLIRRWLVAPLKNVAAIESRLRKVEFFVENKEARRHLRAALQGWPDTERILARLTGRSILPRDLASLGQALRRIPKIKTHLQTAYQHLTRLNAPCPPALENLLQNFPEEPALSELLEKAIVEAPPHSLRDGGVLQSGFNAELDEVRGWIHEGKNRLLELEKRERDATGISSLKVGFNNIFGYYIEITRTHLARVPETYIRKQTMANAERFITQELKEFETRILGAQERALRLETALVEKICAEILSQSAGIQALSQAVAELDVFIGLAEAAERHRYVKPVIDESDTLLIREGRHPVLDALLPSGTLIANDLDLDGTQRQILILTGPNMSGKSTYLRQTALIVILAQMGSYVPAAEARIGVVDHLFTRIGASDRLAEGESTFMVEMVETAHILNHATPRSLIILDEVGRGTSTYDGISIAWACIEYLSSSQASGPRPQTKLSPGPLALGPKVLFATHYFELTELAEKLSGVHNAHVTAREWEDQVVFLHKVEPGPADRAYGIHVAKLAGVPKKVLDRAQVLLHTLEKNRAPVSLKEAQAPFLPLMAEELDPKAVERLQALEKEFKDLEINSLTPLEALVKLADLKKRFQA
jgi:DNA mismatch repair protein MutS